MPSANLQCLGLKDEFCDLPLLKHQSLPECHHQLPIFGTLKKPTIRRADPYQEEYVRSF